jgi:putative addiction module component (TIGR02574 family)
MSPEAIDLLERALKLPQAARAELAASLIESLDQTADEDAEAAWQKEIARRLRELEDGDEVVPWTEARRRILG